MYTREELLNTIAAQEKMRATLGDAIVDITIAALREKLDALEKCTPTLVQTRKQITVFFADVSGFTAMSEGMDAEDVTNTMNFVWNRLDTIITKHGGKIDKHIGDAIMALWSVDKTREDDAEQAIHAALAMQRELVNIREMHNLQLEIRIGINTGLVFFGTVGTIGELTAMGDTVNTASRLETSAPVGGILISHATYKLIKGIFDVVKQEPLSVKGKTEPLQVYLVKRARPHKFHPSTRGIEGIETHMVGRDAELEKLKAIFYTVSSKKETTLVSIVGEAGIGKSRLLSEFNNWLYVAPDLVCYFKGRATEQTTGTPYALLRGLFALRFQIKEDDSLPTVWKKFEDGVAEYLFEDSERKAHFLGAWLGYNFKDSPHLAVIHGDAQQLNDRGLLYLAQFFSAAAEKNTTIILLEDIHWADVPSLDAIVNVLKRQPQLPLLVLSLARPPFFESKPDWGENIPVYVQIDLHTLPIEQSYQLVEQILQKATSVPVTLHDLIVNQAEGNPFYAEELIKMLIDNGVIVTDEENWQINLDRLGALNVPPTLIEVLQARLDKLDPEDRVTLQRASVIGRIFWDRALVQLAADDFPETSKYLSNLQAKEFIFQRRSPAFTDTLEFTFKHAVLHNVTYESVLKRTRKLYHKQAAQWLVDVTEESDRQDEYAAAIAEHYYLAGEETSAQKWYLTAGDYAAAHFANPQALDLYSQALAFTPIEEREARFNLLLAREKINNLLGNRDAQAADLDEMQTLAGDDAQKSVKYSLRRAWLLTQISEFDAAQVEVQCALDLSKHLEDKGFQAESLNALGSAFIWQGKTEESIPPLREAVSLAQEIKDYQKEAKYRRSLANSLLGIRSYDEAKEELETSLVWAVRQNDLLEQAEIFNILGIIQMEQGDFASAQETYNKSLACCQEIGFQYGEGRVLVNLGNLHYFQGQMSKTLEFYGLAIKIFEQLGEKRGEVQVRLNRASISLNMLGNTSEVEKDALYSLKYAEQVDDPLSKGQALTVLAEAARRNGNLKEARQYMEDGIKVIESTGDLWLLAQERRALGRLDIEEKKPAQALANLNRALEICREAGMANMEPPILALCGLAFIQEERFDEAIEATSEAMSLLSSDIERAYMIPCWHAQVLDAMGRHNEKKQAIQQSYEFLQEALSGLSPAQRQISLEQVPDHYAILKAWEEYNPKN